MIYYNNFTKKEKKGIIIPPHSNTKYKELSGYLEERLAKETLANFLYDNLGFTVFLLTGGTIRLFPFQEILLRNMFNHNFNMLVISRGGSKTWLTAIFCWLYLIFNKGKKIIIASNSFRSSRRLVNQIELTVNDKKCQLLRGCCELDGGKLKMYKRGDEWTTFINEGSITALPLNEKIRGSRADLLICDEFLMIPEDIYKSVLVPFLMAKSNISEQLRIKEREGALIEAGQLTEDQRTILASEKKIIALTSACFDFEFAYKLFKEWVDNITDEMALVDLRKKYFVARISCKAIPEEMLEEEVVKEMRSGGENTIHYQRELMAKFISGSDGYFNIRRLNQSTVPNGELPCVQLKGDPKSEYILAVDPSFSDSASSDMFAMGVYLLNKDARSLTQVHSYGVSGGNLIDHINYFHYLLMNFNIVFISADLAGEGSNFILSANESVIFVNSNVRLKFMEGDFDNEAEYLNELKIAKNSYNRYDKKICYRQVWQSDWIRRGYEYLKAQIEYGKIHFASPVCSHSIMVQKAVDEEQKGSTPIIEIKDPKTDIKMGLLDFMAWQDYLLLETKSQLALIEPKVSSTGNMTFQLPQRLKMLKSPGRPRKDLVSCIVMGNWAAKCYLDMIYTEEEKVQAYFMPFFVGNR